MNIEIFLLAAIIGGASSIVFGRVFSAFDNPYKGYCDRWEALNNKNQQKMEKMLGALEERNEQCNAWRACAEDLAFNLRLYVETEGRWLGRTALEAFERLKEANK